jgi:hypothetical protein
MNSPSSHDPPFRVSYPDATTEVLRGLYLLAVREGRGHAFRVAYGEIRQALATRPRDFGEPLKPLTEMRLMVRLAAVRPLLVRFAVHEELPFVFALHFTLMENPGE